MKTELKPVEVRTSAVFYANQRIVVRYNAETDEITISESEGDSTTLPRKMCNTLVRLLDFVLTQAEDIRETF